MSTINTSGVASTLRKLKEFNNPIFNRFSVLAATAPEHIAAALKVRYEVYCQDKRYLKANAIGVETDLYDDCSTHLLLILDGKVIGCARFVHSGPNVRQLPLEGYSKGLDPQVMNPIRASGLNYAEVSRLAILKEYRGSRDSGRAGLDLVSASAPLIVLVMGIRAYSFLCDIPYMFAGVGPVLRKCLDSFVVKTQKIGEAFEYYGTRVPLLILRDQSRMSPYLESHYERIHSELKQGLERTGMPIPHALAGQGMQSGRAASGIHMA